MTTSEIADAVQAASMRFEGTASDPRLARRFVADHLAAWRLERRVDDVSLAVSELITNSVLHARDAVTVTLLARETTVRLEVHDTSSTIPLRGGEADASMTGRGLSIVESIADRWGVERGAVGKVVWAEFGASASFFSTSAVSVPVAGPASGAAAAPEAGLAELRSVSLHGLPARLTLASNAHLDDIVRELQLMTPEALARLPEVLRNDGLAVLGMFSARTGSEEARRALDAGETTVDLDLQLPADVSLHLLRLGEILDVVYDEIRAGRLLAPPPTSEVVAFRRWSTHEITRQLAGRMPSPCPFEGEADSWDDAASAEEARLREARYRSLIEAAELDVWRAAPSGELISDMPEWRAHTQQATGEVLGLGWLDGVHPDHRDRVLTTWRRAVELGGVYQCEYPIVSPDGTVRQVIARAAPVREGSDVREWVGTTVDVTSQRAAEIELSAQTRLVETLHEIGITLATTIDLDTLLPLMVEATTRLTGAEFGAFFFNRVDEAGEDYQLVTLHGATMDDFRFGMPRNTKIFAPTFTGSAIVRYDDVTMSKDFGQNPPHNGMPKGHLPVRSYLAVPVVSPTGIVHGGLFFGHAEVGKFTDAHERMVAGIAAQAAVAIDNALLLDAERRARAAAEEANRRRALLGVVMDRLSASLDVEATVGALADLVVPSPADWSLVVMRDEAGRERVCASSGRVPATARETGVRLDLRTKEASGAVLFVGRHGDEPFADADLALLDEIALRAAVALDNAVLYDQQRTAALTLQQSLLPQERPALHDVDYVIRYLPGAQGADVGGDFFDIVLLDQTTASIGVGDVQGKGVQAAAYMGQIRAAMRAYTLAGLGPAAVLQFLDRMWEQQADILATVLQAHLDLLTGTSRIATAGHLPPLRFGGPRASQFVDVRPGPPVGTASGVYLESMVTLAPGEGLVLFTDGLVEHRARPIDEGLDALRSVVDAHAATGGSVDDLATAILAELLGDGHDDDVALIVLRRRHR